MKIRPFDAKEIRRTGRNKVFGDEFFGRTGVGKLLTGLEKGKCLNEEGVIYENNTGDDFCGNGSYGVPFLEGDRPRGRL